MPLLVLASLLWSVSFALIGQSGIHPDLLAAARLTLAALVFTPFLLHRPPTASATTTTTSPARPLPLALIGALQFGVMYLAVMRAYRHLQGHEVALLTITTPILVVLAGAALAPRRRPIGTRTWLAALVAVGAAYALRAGAPPPDAAAGTSFWTGVLLVQFANLAWAAGQVLYARLEPGAPAGSARRFGWLYVGAAAVSVSWASTTVTAADLELTPRQLWTIAYLGLVPSGVAFYLWNRGAARVGVGTLAVLNNLKVPLAVAVALAPPFNEPAAPGPLALSSALLVLALWLAHSHDGRPS